MSVFSPRMAGVNVKDQTPVSGSNVPRSVVTTSAPNSLLTGPGASGRWPYHMVRWRPFVRSPVCSWISTDVDPSASR